MTALRSGHFSRRIVAPLAAMAIAGAAILAGCTATAPPDAGEGTPIETVPITLRTDFGFNGYNAPYALGVKNGIYAAAGLDVSIELGQSSIATIQTVAAGGDEFGIAETSSVVTAISNEDVPVKTLAVFTQQSPGGFAYPEGTSLDSPSDLEGRALIVGVTSGASQQLDLMLDGSGITRDDINIVPVEGSARLTAFLTSGEDAVLWNTFVNGEFIGLENQDPTVQYRPFSEFGIKVFSTGLFTSNDMLESNPDVVRAFVAATVASWEAAIADPEAAVDAALEMFPDSNRDTLLQSLQVTIDRLLHTAASADLPPGQTVDEDWDEMLKQLSDTGTITTVHPLDDYRDNIGFAD
jgi:NitT/TauT family transport system substrate-binding protein